MMAKLKTQIANNQGSIFVNFHQNFGCQNAEGLLPSTNKQRPILMACLSRELSCPNKKLARGTDCNGKESTVNRALGGSTYPG